MQVDVIRKQRLRRSKDGIKCMLKNQFDIVYNGRTITVDCEQIDEFIEALCHEVNDLKDAIEAASERTPSHN